MNKEGQSLFNINATKLVTLFDCRKMSQRFNSGIIFCLHLHYGSGCWGKKGHRNIFCSFYICRDAILPTWTQFMYHVPILYSLSALLCVSHNAPCCRLFNSPEHHNGCPLHYIWLAYSRVKFEYILALFTTTSFLRGGHLSNSLNINYHNLLKAL